MLDPDDSVELQEALHEAFEALEEAHQQLDVVLTHPPPDAARRLDEAQQRAEEYLEVLRKAKNALKG